MPKYKVTAEFQLDTAIEPDGIRFDLGGDGIEECDDNSYFRQQDVECEGGEVVVTVVADDEDEAEQLVRDQLDNGSEYEDQNGYTWVVAAIQFTVERESMDRDTALEIVQALLERLYNSGVLSEDEKQALEVILAN